jgi:hypothetical protein
MLQVQIIIFRYITKKKIFNIIKMKNNNIFFILIIIISLLIILPKNSVSSFGTTTTVPSIFHQIKNTVTQTGTFYLESEPDSMNIICVGGGGSGGNATNFMSGNTGGDTTVTFPADDGRIVKASGGGGGNANPITGGLNICVLGGAVQIKDKTNVFSLSTAGGGGTLSLDPTVNLGNGGGAGTPDSNGDDGDILYADDDDTPPKPLTGTAGEGFVTKDQLNTILAEADTPFPYYGKGYGYGSASYGGTSKMSGGGGGGYTSYSLPIYVKGQAQSIPIGTYNFSVGQGGAGVGTSNKSLPGGTGYAVVTYSYTKYLVQFTNQSQNNTAVVTNGELKYYIKPGSIYLTYLNKNQTYTLSVNSGLFLDKTIIKPTDYTEVTIKDFTTKFASGITPGYIKISFLNETVNKLSDNSPTVVPVTIKEDNSNVKTTLYIISDNETYHYIPQGKNYTISVPKSYSLSQSGSITISKETLFTISSNSSS